MNKNTETKKRELSLPIVVKESKTTETRLIVEETVAKKDEIFEKIIAESSLSDEQKLAKIREVYEIKIENESILSENALTKENVELVDSSIPMLKEWNLSWAGKLFFAGAAAYIAGKVIKNMPLKIRGTKEQMTAIADAIVASKAFQDELKKPGASIETVIKKMNLRNVTRERFQQITGKAFPL